MEAQPAFCTGYPLHPTSVALEMIVEVSLACGFMQCANGLNHANALVTRERHRHVALSSRLRFDPGLFPCSQASTSTAGRITRHLPLMAPLTTRDTAVPDSLPIIIGATAGFIVLIIIITVALTFAPWARGRSHATAYPDSQTSGGFTRGRNSRRGGNSVSTRSSQPLGLANNAHRELSLHL